MTTIGPNAGKGPDATAAKFRALARAPIIEQRLRIGAGMIIDRETGLRLCGEALRRVSVALGFDSPECDQLQRMPDIEAALVVLIELKLSLEFPHLKATEREMVAAEWAAKRQEAIAKAKAGRLSGPT